MFMRVNPAPIAKFSVGRLFIEGKTACMNPVNPSVVYKNSFMNRLYDVSSIPPVPR